MSAKFCLKFPGRWILRQPVMTRAHGLRAPIVSRQICGPISDAEIKRTPHLPHAAILSLNSERQKPSANQRLGNFTHLNATYAFPPISIKTPLFDPWTSFRELANFCRNFPDFLEDGFTSSAFCRARSGRRHGKHRSENGSHSPSNNPRWTWMGNDGS